MPIAVTLPLAVTKFLGSAVLISLSIRKNIPFGRPILIDPNQGITLAIYDPNDGVVVAPGTNMVRQSKGLYYYSFQSLISMTPGIFTVVTTFSDSGYTDYEAVNFELLTPPS